METVDVVFFDAGGGHRSTALALLEASRAEEHSWRAELVNLQHVLERIDILRRTTGVYSQDIYNWSLRHGWTQATSLALPAVHGLIRLLHPLMVRQLCDFWRTRRPAAVISVVPHYNRALCESVTRALPGTPLLTVMTDLADHPPHFWLERQNQYFVCGSHRAMEQARNMGIPRDRVRLVSGMAVHPRFYGPMPCDRSGERMRLGLDPDIPTGLVLFGGYGSAVMVDIMERIAATPMPVQLILLCGRNARLAAKLASSRAPIRRVAETFTNDVARYMRLSDFFIGKPGPGSISEALVMQLPVIVERNARTMVQERYNCDWIQEERVGIVVDSFTQIGAAVARLLDPAVYTCFRERIGRLNNRAVFEIVDVIDGILRNMAPPMDRAAGARRSLAG
jgi:UDP-N-acetylglucosamine:LPS N-acetylglucosamine transferase